MSQDLVTSGSSDDVSSNGTSQLDDTFGQYDLSAATLSLSETDIDLGELIEEDDGLLDSTMDLSAHQDSLSAQSIPHKDDSAPTAGESSAQTFENENTYGADRYDMEFDATGEWIDIDLDEKT